MALYGSVAAIEQLLRSVTNGTFSTDEVARITDARAMVSAVIESKTGAVFGVSPAPTETIVVDGEGGSLLFLPKGIRTVTSLAEHPDWNGTGWVNGTLLATTAFRASGKVANGAYRQLIRTDGGWFGPYVVVGVWEDQVPTVPDEITYAVNFISAEIFKAQSASPHGLMGPEGALVPIRDAFKAPEVLETIQRWSVGPCAWVA
jgi:hypothetical protein